MRKAAREGVRSTDFKILEEGPTSVVAERCCFNQWEWNTDAGVYARPIEGGTEAAGLIPHRERYEHFGTIDCFVGDPTRLTGVAA